MLVYVLGPLVFMVTASLMPASEVTRIPYRWIPNTFYWQNFWQAIRGNDGRFYFVRNMVNSLFVATAITLTTVVLSTVTGYGLAKFTFRGRKAIMLLIVATMMIPFQVIMIPLYIITTNMGMQNSYAGLIVPFLVNAFGVFLMRQHLLTFPDEILDAARIDGASEVQILWRVVFPSSWPAIATLAVLTFRTQWDNLMWPLLIAQSREMQTIPLYITLFAEEKFTDEGAMMATAVLASLPMVVLFLGLSRYFVGGARLFSAQKG
ncbi:MAG TPA: carbohydrate ABC transporter permease [Candidatus Bipolaricaulis sp.]|nr:carbohydrate ABC transporter permease [Candidatus Bipolaricaulis sp.]HPD06658.1 carbohydrate ABC transporter permease [Candidatus Bipolaricaulis sp.]HRS13754.1 carbohydrate ABC transporter permease [Candidatus Bipolaricaulis sp.]HRU21538.1 carbohydrate ABC transporter permease [Candidatus Bipolaricaulis sp.]